jgi:integrase
MSRRPVQDVRIWSVQDRRSNPNARSPWVARWVVDGKAHSKAFRTRALADRYRSRLLVAFHDGERFDRQLGEPESWRPPAEAMPVYVWARAWVLEQWQEWAPRTRRCNIEALSRFLPLVCAPEAPAPPTELRAHLQTSLRPDGAPEAASDPEKWLSRWGLSLGDLNRSLLADVERRLSLGDAGQPLAMATAGRYRKVAHSCVRRAVELEKLPSDPWPPAPKGRNRRKARRRRQAVDVRVLPGPDTMVAAIDAIRSHQPGSRMYQVMTAIAYYAGLRPSEVVMLRPRALHLPSSGWGRIEVVEADIDYDESGEPKTADRSVPIPPRLVELLRAWIAVHGFGNDDLLFRTRNDRRPAPSNWSRALKRALAKVGHRPLRVYDLRHAAATTWLRAGVPLGEVARRLGHSVETLVSTYVGALQGDDTASNTLIDTTLASTRDQIVLAQPGSSRALPTDRRKAGAKPGNRGQRRATP